MIYTTDTETPLVSWVYREARGREVGLFGPNGKMVVKPYRVFTTHAFCFDKRALRLDPHEVERQIQIAAEQIAAQLRQEILDELRRAVREAKELDGKEREKQ